MSSRGGTRTPTSRGGPGFGAGGGTRGIARSGGRGVRGVVEGGTLFDTGTSGEDSSRRSRRPRTDNVGAGGGRRERERESGTASALSREVKQRTPVLQNLLDAYMPWRPEVEDVRQKLRQAHYSLVTHHPSSPYSQSIDHMWISTSHLLITSYRSLIGNLEKRLSQGLEHSRGSGSGRGRYRTGEGGDSSGPVELRKLLARFQGFLNGEIGWYKSAIGEWVRVFGLEGVEGVIGWLGVVGISVVDDRDPSIPRNTIRHKLGVEEQEKKLGLIHKALICLGDLERYKDQYGAERERRKRVGGDDKERYGGAKKFYEVARGLLPDNGNPWNQLALVSNSTLDTFTSIYCYLRALAVSQPFATAELNLVKTFKRVLADWTRLCEEEGRNGFKDLVEGEEANAVKEEMMVLQATLYLGDESHQLVNLVTAHRDHVRTTVTARLVPTESIAKVIVMCIAAHWQTRLGKTEAQFGGASAHERMYLEYTLLMTGTLLEVASAEFGESLGSEKLAVLNRGGMDEYAVEDDEDDERMHFKISAVVRRLLPPLRIFSKWLKANQDVLQSSAMTSTPSALARGNVSIQDGITRFWDIYLEFLGRMEALFPLEKLPMLSEPLEEDYDMRGFAPLRLGMLERVVGVTGEATAKAERHGRGSVHPNEEQLMRISDLLIDGKLIVQGDRAGLFRNRGAFATKVLNGHLVHPHPVRTSFIDVEAPLTPLAVSGQRVQLPSSVPGEISEEIDAEIASVSTETEDDPVNLAMRATMGDGSSLADEDDERDRVVNDFDDEEEEEVVWGNRFIPPVNASLLADNPYLATLQLGGTRSGPADGRPVLHPVSTAEDLLQSLMIGSTPLNSGRVRDSGSFSGRAHPEPPTSAASPNLLFGTPVVAPQGHRSSIWSLGAGEVGGQPMSNARSGSGSGYARTPLSGHVGDGFPSTSAYPTANGLAPGTTSPWPIAFGTANTATHGHGVPTGSPWSAVGGPATTRRDSSYLPFGETRDLASAPGQGRPAGYPFSPFGS